MGETKTATVADDPTKGLNALVPDLPEFSVGKRNYRMTRLGLKHAMLALRIFAAASSGIIKLNSLKNMQNSPATIALSILSALPYAENHVKDLVSSSLTRIKSDGTAVPVSTKEIDDPEQFPLDSLISIIEGLGKHPDLKSFLKNIDRLQETPLWEELQNRGRQGAEDSTQPNDSSDN